VKDLALITFRAYGWQLGKYRELGGAVGDFAAASHALVRGQKPVMTHRMAYSLALFPLVGALGMVTQYLMTGKWPEDWRDYYMPRTGELDAQGREARVNHPSYVKDLISMRHHPLTTVQHALNPLLGVIADLWQNKDFYGVQLFKPGDKLLNQMEDVGLFLGKQFVPFSVSGALRLADDAAPLHKQIMPFFGIVPAAQRNVMDATETLLAEAMAAQFPIKGRPREAFERSRLLKEIVGLIKKGNKADARTKFRDGVKRQLLNEDSMGVMIGRMKYNTIQFQAAHVDSETAMRAWRMGTPIERRQLLPGLASKIIGSGTVPKSQQEAWLKELKAGMRN